MEGLRYCRERPSTGDYIIMTSSQLHHCDIINYIIMTSSQLHHCDIINYIIMTSSQLHHYDIIPIAYCRIYGDKAPDIIEGLKKSPSVALPIVLKRYSVCMCVVCGVWCVCACVWCVVCDMCDV